MSEERGLAELFRRVVQHEKLHAEQERREQVKAIHEHWLKTVTTLYDKASTYTTVVVFGGYAGFFGLWTIAKEDLEPKLRLIAVLSILVSMTSFVLFEVVKTMLVSKQTLSRSKVLTRPEIQSDPKAMLEAIQSLDVIDAPTLARFIKFWNFTLMVSIPTAVFGVVVLVLALVQALFGAI